MSEKRNDGGLAFPLTIKTPGGSFNPVRNRVVPDGEVDVHIFTGMTLRDYFAAKALEGFCASPHTTIEWLRDHCATSCYQMADAMLKAREA